MKLRLWWVPLLLLLAPAFGLAPQHRDLPDFFAPMRSWTADRMAAGVVPWINPLNGAGEAWFANPETGVLYPLTWLHLVAPTPWALTAEIALHLAWLSLGVGLLARRWGADAAGCRIAEAAAWSAGPVAVTIGVLNNLESLAWLPWMVLAANARQTGWIVPGVALSTAAAWLAGEPQLWALGVALVLVSAPRRRVVVGVALGIALVAVQMVPFSVWVAQGDRGPGTVDDLLRGYLVPAEWLGLVHPMPPTGDRMVFAESLFVSAPILVLMILGARRRPWVAVGAVLLLVLATLPALGAGTLYLAATAGLVRYPGRFALVGIAMLLPVAALGWRPWLEGRGRVAAAVTVTACVTAVLLRPAGDRVWLTLLPAVTVAAAVVWPGLRVLRAGSVVVGLASTVAASLLLLDLGTAVRLETGTVWREARGSGRVWTPAPDVRAMAAITTDFDLRRAWPMGYLNLTDGVAMADTPAPVTHRALRHHLAELGRGPEARWWLDTLGARLVVLPPGAVTPADFDLVASRGDFSLWRNPTAVPLGRRVDVPPSPNDRPPPQPALTVVRRDDGLVTVDTLAVIPGVMWFPVTPVAGWTWALDGQRVQPGQGPGVLQFLEVPAGRHRIEARYRPPGGRGAALVSLGALLLVVTLLVRRGSRAAGYDAVHEGGP